MNGLASALVLLLLFVGSSCTTTDQAGGSAAGRVVDAITGIGIFQIQVACVADGSTVASTRSGGSGEFSFDEDGCDLLAASDVDGPANGSYVDATVSAGETVIELAPR